MADLHRHRALGYLRAGRGSGWTRLMGMMLGATVYVFSIILAVFLIGLALGSAAGSWLLRRVSARLALGWCQVLLALAIAWAAYAISQMLPYWPDDPLTTGPWQTVAAGPGALHLGDLSGRALVGRELPLAFAAAAAGRGIRTPGGRRLRRQHAGRNHRRAYRQPGRWFPGSERNTRSASCCWSRRSAAMVLAPYARRPLKAVALGLTVSIICAACWPGASTQSPAS